MSVIIILIQDILYIFAEGYLAFQAHNKALMVVIIVLSWKLFHIAYGINFFASFIWLSTKRKNCMELEIHLA